MFGRSSSSRPSPSPVNVAVSTQRLLVQNDKRDPIQVVQVRLLVHSSTSNAPPAAWQTLQPPPQVAGASLLLAPSYATQKSARRRLLVHGVVLLHILGRQSSRLDLHWARHSLPGLVLSRRCPSCAVPTARLNITSKSDVCVWGS